MKGKLSAALAIFALVMALGLAACGKGTPGTTPGSTSSSPTTSLPPTSTSPSPTPPITTGAIPPTPAIPSLTPPAALISNRSTLNATPYVVFAWNDLGMHCSNPTYDKLVLLPPYNNLWVQVVKRGDPPQVVTTGLTVEYRIINNTYTYGKGGYGAFWDNAQKLFGAALAKNTGLNLVDPTIHNGLSGTMTAKTGYFIANGIPLSPINDDGSWNPFQVAQVTVKDASGKIVAQTDATVPISDEINCSRCHGADAFTDILTKHDGKNGTSLLASEPVLCASCHGDPALGAAKGTAKYLSDAIHGFHATVNPQPACYDCHPGQVTQCSRSLAHTAADGNCKTCHGDLTQVSSSIESGRMPWGTEPKCVTCHPNVAEVDTGTTLYRNDTGHFGVYCASCHSSPHAMVPTRVLSDNYQALQYQGAAKTVASCGACHPTSRGEGAGGDFTQTHGGTSPRVPNACATCHTNVTANTAQWPHQFQWQATQGTGTVRGD